MTFATGVLSERSIEVPSGTIEVLVGVILEGRRHRRIEPRDMAVYPRGPDRLSCRTQRLVARQLAWDALAGAGASPSSPCVVLIASLLVDQHLVSPASAGRGPPQP